MSITVTSNFRPGAFRFVNADVMREVGLLARETIRRRTARGVSADGTPFQPYSAGYAKAKGGALGGGGTVNLAVSGAMLNALQVVGVTENTVTLGFG